MLNFEANAAKTDLVTVTIETPLGEMRCTASERGIRSLIHRRRREPLSDLNILISKCCVRNSPDTSVENFASSVPLDPHGTHFRKRV
jgi:hypothetical protein